MFKISDVVSVKNRVGIAGEVVAYQDAWSRGTRMYTIAFRPEFKHMSWPATIYPTGLEHPRCWTFNAFELELAITRKGNPIIKRSKHGE